MQNGDKHLFSSTDSALRALERAGSPPKSIDISNPNTQCQTALDILAYLAHNNTTPWDEGTFFKSIVLKHWTSIGRWCRHFLEKFILAPEEPTTQQGLDFRDRILWALPSLFPSSYVSEDEHGHYARNFLRNSGRFLITPTVKVWLKLLDTCHPTTYKWTVFMLEIYFTRDPRLLQEFEDIIFDSKDRDVIGLSIRKMLQFASSCRFSLVDLGALLEFNMFMLLMTPYFHPSTILHDRFLSCGGVATLVRVLSAFLLGPTLTHFPDGSEGSIAGFKMVESCLNLLKECLDYPFSASEALQAGFLKAVVRAVEHYDHWKEKGSDYLGPALAEVLQRISRLLVYPPVCRRFKRSREKHVTADWEVLIESKYRYLWEVWDSCLYNLDTFNEIRNALKEPGLSLCDYDKCPNQDTGCLKYLRCSSCEDAIYCSYKCAKMNWPEHKLDCSEATRAFGERRMGPDSIESAIFLKLIHHFALYLEVEILERLKLFLDTNPHVQPVLVLEFERVHDSNVGHKLIDESCFDIVDRGTIDDERFVLTKEYVEECLSETSTDDPLELVVLAIFPGPCDECTWPVVTVVNLGSASDEADSDCSAADTLPEEASR